MPGPDCFFFYDRVADDLRAVYIKYHVDAKLDMSIVRDQANRQLLARLSVENVKWCSARPYQFKTTFLPFGSSTYFTCPNAFEAQSDVTNKLRPSRIACFVFLILSLLMNRYINAIGGTG